MLFRSDDLVGWTERKKDKTAKSPASEAVKHKGVLDGLEFTRNDAEDMIMSARVLLGWIKPEDLVAPEEEPAEADPEAEAHVPGLGEQPHS